MGKERIKELAGLGWCVGSRELRETRRIAGEERGEDLATGGAEGAVGRRNHRNGCFGSIVKAR